MSPLPDPATAVVLARPVDWSEVGMDPEALRAIVATVHGEHPGVPADHDPLTGVYPGSQVRPCAQCGVRCWVGPRSLVAVVAGALVGCYRCIVTSQGAGALDRTVSLGNTDVARRPGASR